MNSERISLILMFLLLIGVVGLAAGDFPNPRFEILRTEYLHTPSGSADIVVQAIHDRESGIEYLCNQPAGSDRGNLSCFPTGRSWK